MVDAADFEIQQLAVVAATSDKIRLSCLYWVFPILGGPEIYI